MADFKGLYTIRDGIDQDKNFILATFLRGIYYGDSWFSEIPKDIFMNTYKNVIGNLVNNPTTIIKVACLVEDPNVILGYSVLSAEYSCIEFVYVKSAWRKRGIARSLLPQHPTTVTHLTGLGRVLIKKFSNVIFNPFAINQ